MPTPRHRDPSRFGSSVTGEWVPYEVVEGKLIFACGHSVKIVVGSAPSVAEEAVKAFLLAVADKPCGVCLRPASRLRYNATSPGESEVSGRETD